MSPSITLCSAWQSRHFCDPAQVIKVHFSFLAALLPWKDQGIHKRCMNCLGQSEGCRMPIWEQFKRSSSLLETSLTPELVSMCCHMLFVSHQWPCIVLIQCEKNEIKYCVFWHPNAVLIHRCISHSELHNYIGWIFKWN